MLVILILLFLVVIIGGMIDFVIKETPLYHHGRDLRKLKGLCDCAKPKSDMNFICIHCGRKI